MILIQRALLAWSSGEAKGSSQSKYDRTFVFLYNLKQTWQTTIDAGRLSRGLLSRPTVNQSNQTDRKELNRSNQTKINIRHTHTEFQTLPTMTSNRQVIRCIHRVSKKTCQLIFWSMSVKYEPISRKINGHVLEETLNKNMQKRLLQLKYVIALPCEI